MPGRGGRRYARKLDALLARTDGFAEAMRRSNGLTCIDLGANVGEYTRMLSATAKEVIAFEPDPWTCARLRANLSDLDNVRIENAAAGISDGTVLLYRHPDFDRDPEFHSQSTSVFASKANVAGRAAAAICQVGFIRYLRALDRDIGILKIDIEGAEVDLLEALFDEPALLGRIMYIFAETHESKIPGHSERVDVLRRRAAVCRRPLVNLEWR